MSSFRATQRRELYMGGWMEKGSAAYEAVPPIGGIGKHPNRARVCLDHIHRIII